MLPQNMKLVVIPESRRQFQAVSSLMKRGDVTELIIATDAGREGELVARWIMMKAGWKGKTQRLWISSQTDKAIKDGFKNLKPAADYDNLFRSAQARSEADWLVGLNVTRALTCKYNAQLSAGTGADPDPGPDCPRGRRKSGSLSPKNSGASPQSFTGFTATWRDGGKNAQTFDRNKAEEILKKLQGQPAVLTKVERQRET